MKRSVKILAAAAFTIVGSALPSTGAEAAKAASTIACASKAGARNHCAADT